MHRQASRCAGDNILTYVHPDFVQACGCISELCLGDSRARDNCKGRLLRLGAVQALVSCLVRPDDDLQRLAASGLCNLMVNRNDIKNLAINHGIVEAFARLVKNSDCSKLLMQTCAAGLFNLGSPDEKARYERLQVLDILRGIPLSAQIDAR